MLQYNYDNLQRSLIDVIKEEQAKLGYYREDIRLYYPLSSLNHFFGTNVGADEMQCILDGKGQEETDHDMIAGGMNEILSDKLGMVEVSHRGDRFCFHIPPEGVEYVHENTTQNEFIRELVQLVAKHGCTIDQVYELFQAHSDQVGREKMNNGEFDERIWFKNDVDDPYFYCFKQEGEHMIYHRFLPEDYEDFEF
jgi:hypothetical protein